LRFRGWWRWHSSSASYKPTLSQRCDLAVSTWPLSRSLSID